MGRCDHFDSAGVFGTGFDYEAGGANQAVEQGAFFEGDAAGAGNLATHLAIDGGAGGRHGAEKLDACAFFDAQVPALHRADDFAVAADNEVARAIHGSSE